jgi:hypothetical protein
MTGQKYPSALDTTLHCSDKPNLELDVEEEEESSGFTSKKLKADFLSKFLGEV